MFGSIIRRALRSSSPSHLLYWRYLARLVHGGAEVLLLEPLLQQLEAHDLLKARGTQRIDSTPILAALRTLNHLELVGETMRYALNRLAVGTPAWLQAHLHPAWGERYRSSSGPSVPPCRRG